jgi:FKBP-type peptidyl-prolyl cis-trans isomerase FkpA
MRISPSLSVTLALTISTGCDSPSKSPATTSTAATSASASTASERAGSASAPAPSASAAAASASAGVADSPIVDLVVGTGKEAKDGARVKVHYDMYATSGRKLESSRDRKPKSFVVGAGQVIKGWDAGVVGMRVGGKRRLTIPPALAYGEKGSLPTIPPNATLVFEIELLEVS